MPVSNNSASPTFSALCKIFKARANELAENAQLSVSENTDENFGSNSSTKNTYIQSGGSGSIIRMKNFIMKEIQRLMQESEQFFFTHEHQGQGKRMWIFTMDLLIIELIAFENVKI